MTAPVDGMAADSLPQLWLQRCGDGAGAAALRHKRGGIWRTLAWDAFFAQARHAARALQAWGLRPGDVVSLLCDNRPEWLVAEIAAQAVGGLSHGIYPGATESQVAHALAEAGTRILLVEDAAQLAKVLPAAGKLQALHRIVVVRPEGLHEMGHPLVGTWDDFLAAASTGDAAADEAFERGIRALRPAQPCMLLGTAGTVQAPRLVAATHGQALAAVRRHAAWLQPAAGGRMLSFTPLSQASERSLAWAALLRARPLLLHFPESAATVANDLVDVAPQALSAPPRFWETLRTRTDVFMRDAGRIGRAAWSASQREPSPWWARPVAARVRSLLGLHRLRLAIAADAPLDATTADWHARLGLPLLQGYGLAECAGLCSLQAAVPQAVPPLPPQDLALGLADDGEILVRGLAAGGGLWRQGTLRPLPMRDGALPTGDLGTMAGHGIRPLGRKPAGGMRVVTEVAEEALRACPYIDDAVVLMECERTARSLVTLNEETVRHYAQKNGLPFTDFASLAAQPEIAALLRTHIREATAPLVPPVSIEGFEVLALRPGAQDEAWTPALRLNRRVLAQRQGRAQAAGTTAAAAAHEPAAAA